MKRIYSMMMMLSMMVAALSFTACSSDDDDDNSSGGYSEFVGTWSYQSSTGWTDEVDFFKPVDFWYIQFKSDGTLIEVQEDSSEAQGYAVEYGKWTVSNNKLTVQIVGITATYDVITKESNQMTLAIWGETLYFTKVSDSVIQKYLE